MDMITWILGPLFLLFLLGIAISVLGVVVMVVVSIGAAIFSGPDRSTPMKVRRPISEEKQA